MLKFSVWNYGISAHTSLHFKLFLDSLFYPRQDKHHMDYLQPVLVREQQEESPNAQHRLGFFSEYLNLRLVDPGCRVHGCREPILEIINPFERSPTSQGCDRGMLMCVFGIKWSQSFPLAALPLPLQPGKSFHYQLICFPYDSRHSRLYEMSQERWLDSLLSAMSFRSLL